jgi:hypothetical protein
MSFLSTVSYSGNLFMMTLLRALCSPLPMTISVPFLTLAISPSFHINVTGARVVAYRANRLCRMVFT